MKKILFVLQDNTIGGVLLFVLQTAENLDHKKYKPIVALPAGDAVKLFRKAGIETYEINIKRLRKTLNPLYHLSWLFSIFSSIKEIIKIVNERNVDLIYAKQITQIQAPIASYISNTKLLWHLIALHMPPLLEKMLIPLVKLTADKVVVSCDALAEQLKVRGLSAETTTIHSPVNIERFNTNISSDTIRTELNLGSDDLIIGVIGHISPVKGIEYFLEAASIVLKRNINAKFLVIGAILPTQEKYFTKLKEITEKLHLKDDIIFTGMRKDIPELLATIDILVVSSLSESSPLVVLEAMASGKPIVATKVGGIPEQILDGESGILVPAKDSKAIAASILNLISDPSKMKNMGKAARKRAEELFSIEICVENVENIFSEILSNDR